MTDLDDDLDDLLNGHAAPRVFDVSDLPPYPSAGLIHTVHVPKMPRWSGEDAQDARLMLRAFRSVIKHVYGKSPRVDKEAVFRLRSAAPAMRQVCRTPWAWAAFRMQQWRLSEKSSKRPGIDYVYSRRMAEKHAEYFHRMEESYDVINKVVVVAAHSELQSRWEACRRLVANPNNAPGREVTRRLVEETLPSREYQRLAHEAGAQYADMNADLYRRLAAGEWLWG